MALTPYEKVEQIRKLWRNNVLTRASAIAQIRATIDVTHVGAEDILAHRLSPAERIKVG